MHSLSLGITVLCSTALSAGIAIARDEVIHLGGVRDVTATISHSQDGYRIAVEMLPVKAFDPPTNKRLNLAKARAYAIQALATFLNAGQLEIRGVQIQESSLSEGMYRLVLLVPQVASTASADGRQRVAASKATPSTAPSSKRPAEKDVASATESFATDFLNRKSDYLDTIVQLQSQFCADGVAAEKQATEQDRFYSAIGDIEERAESAFKAVAVQINEDKLLLFTERDELQSSLRKSHNDVLASLKAAVAQFDKRQEKKEKTK